MFDDLFLSTAGGLPHASQATWGDFGIVRFSRRADAEKLAQLLKGGKPTLVYLDTMKKVDA